MKEMDVYIPTKDLIMVVHIRLEFQKSIFLAPIDFFWDNQSTILGAKKI